MPNPVINRRLNSNQLSKLNKDWLARVLAAGGSRPSRRTFKINDQFYKSLNNAGLIAPGKVSIVNLFAPDNLGASYTPIIQGASSASWPDTGSTGTIADLTVNGLKRSTGGGNNRFLECGILPGTFMTSGSGHGTVYVSEDSKGATEAEWGCGNGVGTNDIRMFAHLSDNNTYGYFFAQARLLQASITTGNLLGYLCISRTTTTRSDLYFANSATTHASVANDTGTCTTAPSSTITMKIFADSQNGAVSGFSNKRLSAVTFGLALTAAESLALFNAVQNARIAFGGGFA